MNIETTQIDFTKKEALNEIREVITLYTHVANYGLIDVKFANKALTSIYATETGKIFKLILLLIYIGKRISRIREGKIPSHIEEYLATIVLFNTSDEVEMLQITKTHLKRW